MVARGSFKQEELLNEAAGLNSMRGGNNDDPNHSSYNVIDHDFGPNSRKGYPTTSNCTTPQRALSREGTSNKEGKQQQEQVDIHKVSQTNKSNLKKQKQKQEQQQKRCKERQQSGEAVASISCSQDLKEGHPQLWKLNASVNDQPERNPLLNLTWSSVSDREQPVLKRCKPRNQSGTVVSRIATPADLKTQRPDLEFIQDSFRMIRRNQLLNNHYPTTTAPAVDASLPHRVSQ